MWEIQMLSLSTEHTFLWAFLNSPWSWLALWLLGTGFITFAVFGLDKWRSKPTHKGRRIPERRLFLLAAIGGSLGALLGMYVFHHKTKHDTFRFGIPAILLAQLTLLFLAIVYFL